VQIAIILVRLVQLGLHLLVAVVLILHLGLYRLIIVALVIVAIIMMEQILHVWLVIILVILVQWLGLQVVMVLAQETELCSLIILVPVMLAFMMTLSQSPV
jgi:hypothetical protein